MSQAGNDAADTASASLVGGFVPSLADELRSALTGFSERELRREERMAAFEARITDAERAISQEVDRLRATTAAVDLITDHLRQAAAEQRQAPDPASSIADLAERVDQLIDAQAAVGRDLSLVLDVLARLTTLVSARDSARDSPPGA